MSDRYKLPIFTHVYETRAQLAKARAHYPDPSAKAGEPWVVVDVKAVEPLPQPVTLEAVKQEPKLKDMALLKQSRLSVQPVTDAEWKIVYKMGGLK